jgi:hypothetical protein
MNKSRILLGAVMTAGAQLVVVVIVVNGKNVETGR